MFVDIFNYAAQIIGVTLMFLFKHSQYSTALHTHLNLRPKKKNTDLFIIYPIEINKSIIISWSRKQCIQRTVNS